MFKWHNNPAAGLSRGDLQICVEGIASSLRAFHVSASRAADNANEGNSPQGGVDARSFAAKPPGLRITRTVARRDGAYEAASLSPVGGIDARSLGASPPQLKIIRTSTIQTRAGRGGPGGFRGRGDYGGGRGGFGGPRGGFRGSFGFRGGRGGSFGGRGGFGDRGGGAFGGRGFGRGGLGGGRGRGAPRARGPKTGGKASRMVTLLPHEGEAFTEEETANMRAVQEGVQEVRRTVHHARLRKNLNEHVPGLHTTGSKLGVKALSREAFGQAAEIRRTRSGARKPGYLKEPKPLKNDVINRGIYKVLYGEEPQGAVTRTVGSYAARNETYQNADGESLAARVKSLLPVTVPTTKTDQKSTRSSR